MHTVSPPRCIKQKADQDSNKHCHSHRHFRFHSNPCVRAGTALEALLNSICFYIFFCFLFVTRRVRAHHPRPERACMHACMEAGQKSACTDQYVSSCATASAAVLRRSSNKTAATHNSCRPAQHIAQLLCAFFFFFFFSCLALHISIAPAPSVPTLVSACAGVEYAFSRSCLTFDIAIHAGRQKKHAPGEFQTNPIVEAVIDRVIMLSRSEGLDMRNLTRNSVPRRWLIIRLAQIRCILEALKTLRPRIDLCD